MLVCELHVKQSLHKKKNTQMTIFRFRNLIYSKCAFLPHKGTFSGSCVRTVVRVPLPCRNHHRPVHKEYHQSFNHLHRIQTSFPHNPSQPPHHIITSPHYHFISSPHHHFFLLQIFDVLIFIPPSDQNAHNGAIH